MKTIRVFIFASDDLAEVRTAVQDLLLQLNGHFQPRGVEFVSTLPSEGPTDGDIALVLYWKDFGSLSQSDFEKAYDSFKTSQTPKIYVFFKDPDAGITEALKAFRDSFADRYGHFYCHFEVVDSVKFQMTVQGLSLLPDAKMTEKLTVEGGEVWLGNESVAKLENLPFAKLNAKRKSLVRRIAAAEAEVEELEADAEASPEDADLQEALREARVHRHDLKEALKQYDDLLFSNALFFARESGKEMDERVRRARDLFERGRVTEANKLLDLTEMVDRANRNLILFQGQSANCEKDIQAFLAKAEMVMADGSLPFPERFRQACEAYDNAIRIAKEIHYVEEQLAEMFFDYASLMVKQHRFQSSISFYEEALAVHRRLAAEDFGKHAECLAVTLGSLAFSYRHTGRFTEAEEGYKQALEICRRLVEACPGAYESRLVWVLSSLACLHGATRQQPEAREEYKEVLDICRRHMANNPTEYEPIVAMTLNDLVILNRNMQEPSETDKQLLDALEIYCRLAKENPDAYDEYVAWTRNNMAVFYGETHRLADAEEQYKAALETYRRLANENPEVYEPDVARSLNNLAHLYYQMQRLPNAVREFKNALEIYRRLSAYDADEYERYVAATLHTIAILCAEDNRTEDAKLYFRAALEACRKCEVRNPCGYADAIGAICEWLKEHGEEVCGNQAEKGEVKCES